MRESFLQRYNITLPEKEITVRWDAPRSLREYIPTVLYDISIVPSFIRRTICSVIGVAPDLNNWSERPNIEQEVQTLLADCEWYYVYEIIEVIFEKLSRSASIHMGLSEIGERDYFQMKINEHFIKNGIGWKLNQGILESRGDKEFETAILEVEVILDERSLPTAKNEIKEAIKCISRRPEPDITGAIQHSLAALECVSRKATGDEKMTLGELIKTHPGIVPAPLDKAISMIWGFSSEQGRHLREGRDPQFEEAELMVHLSATLCTYLGKKHIEVKVAVSSDDSPF